MFFCWVIKTDKHCLAVVNDAPLGEVAALRLLLKSFSEQGSSKILSTNDAT
jgi:hypothetical protein